MIFVPGWKPVRKHVLKNTQLNEKTTKIVNGVIHIFGGSYMSFGVINSNLANKPSN